MRWIKTKALSPSLFNLVLKSAVRRMQTNDKGPKLNSLIQALAYWDDLEILRIIGK